MNEEWNKIVVDCDDGVRLTVKVTPGSSKTQLLGPHGGSLKIAVAAPPEKGKANQELIELLSTLFGVQRNRIAVRSGPTRPKKTLFIQGATAEYLIGMLKNIFHS